MLQNMLRVALFCAWHMWKFASKTGILSTDISFDTDRLIQEAEYRG